ncbi:permease [Lentzea alba]|uniref:permease n=1 Tax=Lentzea alba TaxID=2714351 RepID=UPI0039BF0BD9
MGERRIGPVEVLAALLVVGVLARGHEMFQVPIVQTWAAVFVSIVLQALPFLTLGVVLSAVIAVYVSRDLLTKVLPRNPVLAVPAAAAAGAVLPGCECGSVPVAGALLRKGIAPAVALTFLLAAPAVNPIVLVATAVAFPGQPGMVLGRAAASLLAASVMGWLWLRKGRTDWIRMPEHSHEHGFLSQARHDFLHAGGFLVIGAMAAATLNVLVPGRWLQLVADTPWLAVVAMAGLAVLLSLCSEADAFVAASFTQFSTTAKLTFLVVGPMVDLKLFAMQTGMFGRRFALRFAPATLVVATASAVAVGALL